MADNFDDLKKQIAQLKKEIKNLGGETFTDMDAAIKSFGGGIEGAKKVIVDMKKDVSDLRDTFGTISTTLRNIVADLKGSVNYTKETEKGFDKLENLTRKIAEHKKDEEILTVKQLKGIQKQTAAEVQKLELLVKGANAAFKQTDAYKEANDALNKKTGFLKDINKQVENELETEKQIQKNLGVTGGLFKGITKSLEHIGIESEHFEHINKDLREAAKNGNSFKVLGAGVKSVGSSIKEAFSDPLVQVASLGKLLHGIIEYANEFDNETIKIQRDLGLSKDAAFEMNMELEHTAQHIGRTHKDAVQANADMNAFLGTNVMLSEKQLEDQISLTKNAGLEADVREGIYKFSQLTGKTQEEVFNSIGKQNKGVLSNKKVLAEVAKTSGQLAAQYKNNPELIGKAVVQAQKLGMTLEQTKKITSGLLNFEDSIAAEMEAELLTGQDLNLEKARGLALQGDTAGAAEELMKNLGPNGLAKFQKMNVIQQEAYAKALGMSADELGDSLVRQKQLNVLDAQGKSELQKKVDALKAEGKEEKAAELERLAIENKSVTLAEQKLTLSEKSAESAEKLKESFNKFMVGPVSKAMDFFTNTMQAISDSPILQGLVGAVGVAATATGMLMVGKSILKAFQSPLGTEKNKMHVIVDGGGGSGGGGGDDDSGYDGPRTKSGKPDKRSKAYRNRNKNKKSRGGKRKGIIGKALGGLSMAGSLLGLGGDDEEEGGDDLASSAMDMASSTSGSKGGFFSKMMSGASNMMSNLNPMKALKSAFSGPNLKKIVGYLPKVGKLAQLAMTAYSMYSGAKGIAGAAQGGASYQDVGKEAVQSLGDLGGTVIGGIVGSLIPGAGTFIGGLLGGMGGSALAGLIADNVDLTGFGKTVVDVLGPGKPMATGGIVTGPTRALIGEAGSEAVIPLDKFYAKLDELISVVKSGGHVYLDGTKVGTAMNVSTYRVQ